jgi:hypothetical protein
VKVKFIWSDQEFVALSTPSSILRLQALVKSESLVNVVGLMTKTFFGNTVMVCVISV